jgi:hypothetical protein
MELCADFDGVMKGKAAIVEVLDASASPPNE